MVRVYLFLSMLSGITLSAQDWYWQQRVKYKMKIDFDVDKHQFKGEQELKYWNNSPDTLHKVFYHLYFNAFQPGSMMDVRSQTLIDPDQRVETRIGRLRENEIGYQKIDELKQDGQDLKFEIVGTILEVELNKPLYPGKSATFEMKFNSQVPIQILRSGRDNHEGVEFSMAQWYPKLCEYDAQGWHANPYVGREFYGVWGDYEVEIKIDGKYILAAGGKLTNANKIGLGYGDKGKKRKNKKVTWKWKAENVHDFVWAADRDYVVEKKEMYDGTLFYFVYQPGNRTTDNWKKLPEIMDSALQYIEEHFGKYPYPSYAFIQGGDRGMEYPLATLITGERTIGSLVGVCVHELMHSWYHMMLGTNEALYAWMDEGFTGYASAEVMNYLRTQKLIPGAPAANPQLNGVSGLIRFHKSGIEEPLSIHADHFKTTSAYVVASYTKGQVLLEQLNYIIGKEAMYKGLKRYYNTWKFKHPSPNDFFRSMEKESGIELDWLKEYFMYTADYPDYAITSIAPKGEKVEITLSKIGRMPMPLDLVVTYADGTQSFINIPLRIMRGHKPNDAKNMQYILAEDWPWTNPSYSITLDYPLSQIKKVEIDPSGRMLDLNRSNNIWEASGSENVDSNGD